MSSLVMVGVTISHVALDIVFGNRGRSASRHNPDNRNGSPSEPGTALSVSSVIGMYWQF